MDAVIRGSETREGGDERCGNMVGSGRTRQSATFESVGKDKGKTESRKEGRHGKGDIEEEKTKAEEGTRGE